MAAALSKSLRRLSPRSWRSRSPGPRRASSSCQVCADASDPTTAARELKALSEAAAELPRARPRLLTLTNDGAPTEPPPGVTVQPAYEWMLENAGV